MLEMSYRLPAVSIARKSDLPRGACIYFVSDQKEVIYIGQTKDLKSRFVTHHRLGDFRRACASTIRWVEPDSEDMQSLEHLLITTVKPRLNKAGVTCGDTCPNQRYLAYLTNKYMLDIAPIVKKIDIMPGYDCFDYISNHDRAISKPTVEKIDITPDITPTAEKKTIIDSAPKVAVVYELTSNGEPFDLERIQYHGFYLDIVLKDDRIWFRLAELAADLYISDGLVEDYLNDYYKARPRFIPAVDCQYMYWSIRDTYVCLGSLYGFLLFAKHKEGIAKYKAYKHISNEAPIDMSAPLITYDRS